MDPLDNNTVLTVFLIVVAIGLIPAILFLITQQNTLKAIKPENRIMAPGEVWLQLIPLFNFVWCFIVVNRIAESIRRELSSSQSFSFEQNQSEASYYEGKEKPTQQIGITMCVLNLISLVPVIGVFAGIAAIVCWIIYWVKLVEYKNQILNRNYAQLDPMNQSNDQRS